MQNDMERLHAVDSHHLVDGLIKCGETETPEEREAFELLERRQHEPQLIDNRQAKINTMAAIARQCKTTSIDGICALLVDAGYEIGVKHG